METRVIGRGIRRILPASKYRGFIMLARFMRLPTMALLVCAMTTAFGIQGLADTAEGEKPLIVVRATTNIPDQGKPVLDLLDLERYVAKQLADRTHEEVAPFS